MLARIEADAIVELRPIQMTDIPLHKRDRWRPVEGEPPTFNPETEVLIGPALVVESDRVRRTFKIEPRVYSLSDYEDAIEEHLEATARSRGYKSEASILSYMASTNPLWASEARAFAAWRDAVWSTAYDLLAEVKSGARPAPAVSRMLDLVPAIRWPE